MSEQMDFNDGKYTVIYDEGHFKALRYGQPWRDLTGDNLVYAMLVKASQLQAERDALAAKLKELERQEPFKLNWPEYRHNGMGCGLEDRGITDRYEAMRHGWESALKRVDEALPEVFYTRPVPAEPVNARLVEALHNTIDLLWLEDSHSVEFDGTVMFGPSYDFSVLDRRIEFLWPGFDCIVWPGSGLNRKWSAYCTYRGSLWFEKFETEEQAKDQCLRLLDQVMPNHPVSKARAAAEAHQAEPVRLTDEQINGADGWLQEAPFWRVVKFARAIEATVLRKQGFKVVN